MSGSDIAGWVSALAAAGAFAAAAYQLASLRRENVASRAAEIQAVAFETDVLAGPVSADAGEGRSRWVYDFSVANPGRLPVANVQVVLAFQVPVLREHSDRSHRSAHQEARHVYVPVNRCGRPR